MNNENLGYLLSKYFRPIMLTIGVLVTICLVALIAIFISEHLPEKTFISVNVAPSTADIVIDGQTLHNGTYEFEPGDYTINISAAGFASKTITISVQPSSTTPVATYLVNQKEGMAYYEKSSADLQILSTLSDPEVQEFMQAYNQKISIRDHFPIDATFNAGPLRGETRNDLKTQTITDGSTDPRCEVAFCLLVTSQYFDQDTIDEAISDLGYNINDYEVIYDIAS